MKWFPYKENVLRDQYVDSRSLVDYIQSTDDYLIKGSL